jgi:hypothetical protein
VTLEEFRKQYPPAEHPVGNYLMEWAEEIRTDPNWGIIDPALLMHVVRKDK